MINNSFRVKCIEKKHNVYFMVGKIYDVTFGKIHCSIGFPQINSDIYGIPEINSVEELNSQFLNDCKFELVDMEYVEKECPFCEEKNESKLLINTICHKCGAKYDISTGKWYEK